MSEAELGGDRLPVDPEEAWPERAPLEETSRDGAQEVTQAMPLYGRNAIVWSNSEMIGSFITPRDDTLRNFVREAHRRGLQVITELVVNHTSDQHPWFQRARLAKPGSSHRDYYAWSDIDQKYQGTRIIFTDTELSNWAWDPVAKAYYWHRFFSNQPDLNFDNPAVIRSVTSSSSSRAVTATALATPRALALPWLFTTMPLRPRNTPPL